MLRFLRYRFLLVAGLLPYGLGGAAAFYFEGLFNRFLFFIGFVGLIFVLIGVESFNEFFDWRIGTDRVFQQNPEPLSSISFLIGIASFSIALIVAIFLTLKLGVVIIILAVIGFLASLFYLAPPGKFAYRGFGEATIALSYGPLMVVGSYYVQTRRIDMMPIFVSVIPALLLFVISILNEVPDYLQDRLVGKRNICVRIGQKNVVRLCGGVLILFYIIFMIELLSGNLPPLALLGLICLPISYIIYICGIQTYTNPWKFASVIRYMIIQYVIILSILITGYIVNRPLLA